MASSITTETPSSPSIDVDDQSSFSASYSLDEFCDNGTSSILAVLNVSCTWIGVVIAVFLMLIVGKNPFLRGGKYILLNNLIGSSFLLLILSGFLYTELAINPCWATGVFTCKVTYYLRTVFTNVSSFLLVGLSIQQLNRYRQQPVTMFNSTHTRCILSALSIWAIAAVVSLPELVFTEAEWYSSDAALCGIFHPTIGQKLAFSAKAIFIEYIVPLLILLVTVLVTGIYVFVARSQYSAWGVTTGGSLVPRDKAHPRHFGLVIALTVAYLLGYFPMYSFELATFIQAESYRSFGLFFWHMDTISTFFALLPPAITPLFVLVLSCDHFDVLKSIYGSLSVGDMEGMENNVETDVKLQESPTEDP